MPKPITYRELKKEFVTLLDNVPLSDMDNIVPYGDLQAIIYMLEGLQDRIENYSPVDMLKDYELK